MSEPLDITRRDRWVELTLNRPTCRNALSRELIARLTEAVRQADADAAVHCVILTGAPPAFCAGLDLHEVADTPADEATHDTTRLLELYETIERSPKPTITAVNGPAAAGGAALLCVCDIVICGQSATIGYPGIRHGLVAPIVMPYLLRLVGEQRARYLLLTGELISARQAVEYGLANEVVPDGELLPRARQLAAALAALPPEAIARTKALLTRLRGTAGGPSAAEVRQWITSVAVTDDARGRLAEFLGP